MLKIFFITFFAAELIIAIAVILKIYNFNKCVNNLNNLIMNNQNRIRMGFIDIRLFLEYFSTSIAEVRALIANKRREYLAKVIETTLIYSSLFFLKGKYKKTILACQIAKEIYEGINEA